ncbi:hypothetical protein SAMN02745124_00421 [Desulfofustis glycolicus DSM 9705]|uniref:Uncharacterized protein n=1 Tax=Desulfofustis glycolicus DSM 9705 TaxID=1121409 RepID=A0A1M5SLE6_9BACT|nr:hypothetical protein SAMN02745124_00421 [Desulfofustis glycolicus DSM 9705]
MYAFTDFIVWLWLLPVTLFIILPLAMLAVWSVSRLISGLRVGQQSLTKANRQISDSAMASGIRA